LGAKKLNVKSKFIITTKELCDILEVQGMSITHWKKLDGFPEPVTHGKWDWRILLKWMNDERRRKGKSAAETDDDKRLKKAKADREEILVAKELETLVDKEEAVRSVRQGMVEMKNIAENMVMKIGQIVPEDVRAEVVRVGREQVARGMESMIRIRVAGVKVGNKAEK